MVFLYTIYYLKNINFNGKTTDDLINGIKNYYLTTTIIHNYFLYLTSNFITTDDIIPSNSNIYFTTDLYSSNFSNNIKLIRFGNDFQQKIEKLPNSVEEIIISKHYKEKIKRNRTT